MKYVFQFGIVWDHLPQLLNGAWLTLRLSFGAFALGFALALVLAFLRTSGPKPAARRCRRRTSRSSATRRSWCSSSSSTSRCPRSAFAWKPVTAALIGMSINFSGYATEIVRSGIESVPRSQIEAGQSMGFDRCRSSAIIVLFPALRTVYPALASQFILLMLGSSIVAAISAEELTAVTNSLQSTTFRSFEFYFVATGMYLAMALGARLLLHAFYWAVFERGRPAAAGWAR